MKIVHIESGLGNQMLSYGEYLVIKKLNPNDDCFIETIIYEIPECNNVINQWNGYELDRIFHIDAPNIKSKFSETQWNEVIADVRNSKFWENQWRYATAIVTALNRKNLHLKNVLGDTPMFVVPETNLKTKIKQSRGMYHLKRILRPLYQKKLISKYNNSSKVFLKTEEDIFTGQTLCLRVAGVDIGFIDKELREAFCFPDFDDQSNIDFSNFVVSCNSVAIHARRGDMLMSNGYCYKYGYFKRAVKFIKKRVTNPVFCFFCDTGSIDWCKNNAEIFGLDFRKDAVYFVDWNKGNESYRDMQLMAKCKHNIITNSSFGWWGAYLNDNSEKITCSPNAWINTTHTF